MKYNLAESTSTLVKMAGHLFVRMAARELKKLKVPHGYTPFLMHLWEEDGQTQAVLRRKIGIEQPTAVRTIERMKRDGFIKCVRSEADKREIKIYLTVKAAFLQGKVYKCAETINDIAKQGLQEKEKKQLNNLLKKIIVNLQENLLES